MEKILEIKNLTKKYKNGRGIEDISLTVNSGDVVGLLGPNGSGKTTIIKSVAGLITPNSGSVSIMGCDTESMPEMSRKKAGFLIEEPALFEFMTAEQNLKIAAEYYSENTNNDIKDKITEVLNLVGLGLYKKDKVGRFSLGMKQRLGLAIALVSDPVLTVLDEPFNGLDIEGVIRIRELIRIKTGQNGGCLIAGHTASELEKICTHAAVLHEGKLIAFDSMEEALKTRPSLEDYYISKVRGVRGMQGGAV